MDISSFLFFLDKMTIDDNHSTTLIENINLVFNNLFSFVQMVLA